MVLFSPLWRCTWSIFVIWKPKSILLMATPRLDRRLCCARSRSGFHSLFIINIIIGKTASVGFRSKLMHTRIDFELLEWVSIALVFGVYAMYEASIKRCGVFFFQSSNQPHHFSLIYKFPVYQFTRIYYSASVRHAAVRYWVGCVDEYERRIQSSAPHEACLCFEVHTFTTDVWSSSDCVDVCGVAACGSTAIGSVHSLDCADTGNLTDGYAMALRRRWNNHSTYKNFKISPLSALSILCISVQNRQSSDVS